MGVITFDKPADDKWFEELNCHLLWQATLVDLELRTHHDDRTARVVDALTQQVLAEAPLLTLKHIANALKAAASASCIDSAATTSSRVVNQAIDRFLQHTLLVTLNYLWCVELDKFLETVITVDDAAVEVVEVTRRKASTTQGYHWPQIWWNDWQNCHTQA